MRTLGLCFLVAAFVLVPLSFAQDQPRNSSAADDAIVQLWKAEAAQADKPYLVGDKLNISSDPESNMCLYLRVYRMKRPSKKSDVTIPSGYTTCVPAGRFEKKSSAEPKLRFEPQD